MQNDLSVVTLYTHFSSLTINDTIHRISEHQSYLAPALRENCSLGDGYFMTFLVMN